MRFTKAIIVAPLFFLLMGSLPAIADSDDYTVKVSISPELSHYQSQIDAALKHWSNHSLINYEVVAPKTTDEPFFNRDEDAVADIRIESNPKSASYDGEFGKISWSQHVATGIARIGITPNARSVHGSSTFSKILTEYVGKSLGLKDEPRKYLTYNSLSDKQRDTFHELWGAPQPEEEEEEEE